MSAVITGAVIGAVIASSAVNSGPSEPLTQGTAIYLLALLVLSLTGGGICAYRSRWDRWENMVIGTFATALVLVLLMCLFVLVATALGF